jgi:glycosyltransferase involved in cell wall biosynthesis
VPVHLDGNVAHSYRLHVIHISRSSLLEALWEGPVPGQSLGANQDMTHRLALATLAVDQAMGQQVYEQELARRAPDELGTQWEVHRVEVRTLRSPLPGNARIPSSMLSDASPLLRRATGRFIYRGHDVVHRFDLRLPPAPRPEVLTVHDVVSWRFADEGQPPSDAAATARRAEVVVCPSQFSADEVAAQLHVANVVAIPNGVNAKFFTSTPLPTSGLEALGIRGPFVLHAGGCTQRKNLAGLAAAWSQLRTSRPNTRLVLMGPSDGRRDRLFAPLPGTVRIGRVDDDTARGVMAAASAIVVPSLYEGFGLPALEGMALGVPVVASRRSSLPEVCGDAAYLVEPTADGLAEGLAAALDRGPDTVAMVTRGRGRAEQFTWEASAAAHAALWRTYAR